MVKNMEEIKQIAQKIKKEKGKLFLVGGAVRDEMMGIEPIDFDFCVTGLTAKEFLQLFPDAKMIGKNFPVFVMGNYEFALARKENKMALGHKGFEIITSKDITIEQDLKRRDITINAMAKDILTQEIIDPFGGKNDILDKKIRHVSHAFREDPLRVYRTARFAAKFGFSIAEETFCLMNGLKEELTTISKERIFEELKKALATKKPSLFFQNLKVANVLEIHFKEIYDLIGVIQPKQYHPEGDVFEHTMVVLDLVAKETEDVSVRFAALVHDLGKAKTPPDILPKHIGHEEAGIPVIQEMCKRLQLPNNWRKKGIDTAKYHMLASICYKMRPYKLAKFFNTIYRCAIGLEDLEIIVNCDDMLHRKKVQFADLAKQMIKEVNGETLHQKGWTVSKVGYEKYKDLLWQEQAKFLKEKIKEYGYANMEK